MVIPPQWIPNPIVWGNYLDVFIQVPLTLYIRNSLIVTLTATLFGVLTASLAGYGFARTTFPGRNFLFTLCIASLMLPEIVTLIPEFILFRRIGWVNTFLPLIVPWSLAGSSFAVFLFRQYCLTIPLELDGRRAWTVPVHSAFGGRSSCPSRRRSSRRWPSSVSSITGTNSCAH
ncbi:MAG: carbohydrate ABC transporter permease [Caldilineaceae bacterium]